MLRPSLAPCSSIKIKYLREFIFFVLANCGKSENNDKDDVKLKKFRLLIFSF